LVAPPLVILGFLTKSTFFETGEHLAAYSVDRVEAVRNHLTWAMEWKGQRLGIVETRPHYTIILIHSVQTI
jgi:hypothetical protein